MLHPLRPFALGVPMETISVYIALPTMLPGIWVVVTNRVGNEILSNQFIVYECSKPSNEATQTHGIHFDLLSAIQVAQSAACSIEMLASALPPDGAW